MELASPEPWTVAVQIVLITVLLGGDNAVAIALACRKLPRHQRQRGVLCGAVAALGLRAILTPMTTTLLAMPFMKIAGGALLFWIGLQLALPDGREARDEIAARASLWPVVTTILVANFVMSFGHVLAVAAVAREDTTLLTFGLLVSIPIIAWCSRLVLDMMERAPFVTTFGGALLAYLGTDMMTRDPALADWLGAHAAWLQQHHVAGVVSALFVASVAFVIAGMARTTWHVTMEVVSKNEPSAS